MFLLLLYRLDLPLVDLIDEIAAFEVILLSVCYILKSVVGGSTCHEAIATNSLLNAALNIPATWCQMQTAI